MSSFLKKIQKSDDETKIKWLIIMCGITMTIVVILWIIYMSNFVFKSADAQKTEEIETGFWPIFQRGLNITGKDIGLKIKSATIYISQHLPIIKDRKNITIENPE